MAKGAGALCSLVAREVVDSAAPRLDAAALATVRCISKFECVCIHVQKASGVHERGPHRRRHSSGPWSGVGLGVDNSIICTGEARVARSNTGITVWSTRARSAIYWDYVDALLAQEVCITVDLSLVYRQSSSPDARSSLGDQMRRILKTSLFFALDPIMR